MRPIVVLVAAVLSAVPAAAQVERAVGTGARDSLAVTVYNADLALIEDRRTVDFAGGPARIVFEDVSAGLRPETAILRGDGIAVHEQAFDDRVVGQRRLLEAYLGETVGLVRTHPTTGEETVVDARIVSIHDGLVLEVDGRIETGAPGRLVFPALPQGLRTRPALVSLVDAEPGARTVELAYLSRGLSWQTDYVATLSEDEDGLSLAAWATVRNDSGADYPDARLRLVAGDVNQASGGGAQKLYRNQDVAMAEAAPAPPEPQAAGEYHLYEYPQRVTLRDGQVKQLALFDARDVPFDREYRIEGGRGIYTNRYDEPQPQPVTARLLFDNDAASGLGDPLPGGVVRVYRAGAEAGLFLGEARIPDTPEDGAVRVTLGRVFDVRAERRQTDYTRINQPDNTFETAHEIALTNAKDEAVTVIVTESIPGDWTVLEESHPHAKITAGRAEWRIEVPAGGEALLGYRVRVRH